MNLATNKELATLADKPGMKQGAPALTCLLAGFQT